jgi:hypothetical protein
MLFAILDNDALHLANEVSDRAMVTHGEQVQGRMVQCGRSRELELAVEIRLGNVIGVGYIWDGHPGTDRAYIARACPRVLLAKLLPCFYGGSRDKGYAAQRQQEQGQGYGKAYA